MEQTAFAEFSMSVIKTSYEKGSGKMFFRMVGSDTEKDLYDTQMSLELFSDFIRRIENNSPVPEPFDAVVHEDGWQGGMPYLSIAHYKSANGKNVPGYFEKIYIDGKTLKAVGECFDTPIGRSTFRSLCNDLYGKSEYENPIRASIGFLDLKHSHGDFIFTRSTLEDICPKCAEGVGNKVFLAGQLIHIAMTREPVNPRTSMEVDMAKVIQSKREDAESIVEDAITDLDLEMQSKVSNILEIRSDDESSVEEAVEDVSDNVEDVPVVEESVVDTAEDVVATETNDDVETKSPVDVAVENLLSMVNQARSLPKDKALEAIQAELDNVGDVLSQEFATPVSPEMSLVLQSLQSITDRMTEIADTVTSLSTDVAILKEQKSSVVAQSKSASIKPTVPQPRAAQITPHTLSQISANTQALRTVEATTKPNSISELARRSVYGK